VLAIEEEEMIQEIFLFPIVIFMVVTFCGAIIFAWVVGIAMIVSIPGLIIKKIYRWCRK